MPKWHMRPQAAVRPIFIIALMAFVTFKGLALYREKPGKNCLNALAKWRIITQNDEFLLREKNESL